MKKNINVEELKKEVIEKINNLNNIENLQYISKILSNFLNTKNKLETNNNNIDTKLNFIIDKFIEYSKEIKMEGHIYLETNEYDNGAYNFDDIFDDVQQKLTNGKLKEGDNFDILGDDYYYEVYFYNNDREVAILIMQDIIKKIFSDSSFNINNIIESDSEYKFDPFQELPVNIVAENEKVFFNTKLSEILEKDDIEFLKNISNPTPVFIKNLKYIIKERMSNINNVDDWKKSKKLFQIYKLLDQFKKENYINITRE